ncbi:MAG: hypothetical protein NWE80_05050 [Candidatus Bathyarchaeota archaeon]|nr:hypothetical protein [Candidatus Bathyarchaeota archaeon]
MRITKFVGFILISILVISVIVTSIYVYFRVGNEDSKEMFFFGVTYGQNTVDEAKVLMDKVKNYTNLFIINSYPITTNNTDPEVLNEICDYAAKSDLYFIVYFFSFLAGDWQQQWVDTARQKWGEKFLGVYLRDEPGGRQMELGDVVENASTYDEAAENFVKTISSAFSMQFLNGKGVPVFTSDFTLYYYDYLTGYDTVFAEFGWNNSRIREIALCRGASKMLNKDWGVIVTWTYMQPPYIGSGTEIFQDMVTAYDAGAKYVVVFGYPQYPIDNPNGILTDEHFLAMEQFWHYVSSRSNEVEKITAQVAYILPNYYGWGMRHPNDKIWGLWEADEKSSIIWENLNKLETKYGLILDIIYDDPRYDIRGKYYQTYLWNATIN